jgi:membrane protein YqaA with SNARE-associated domain
MLYALTFLWCLPSPIIWLFNAEAWVVGHAATGAEFPVLLAICATASQVTTFTFLYRGGDAVLARLPRLRAKLERFDIGRYRSAGYSILAAASLLGFPPLVLLSLVARTLHYRFAVFLAVCLTGRLARFLVLALAPETFRQIFGATTGA